MRFCTLLVLMETLPLKEKTKHDSTSIHILSALSFSLWVLGVFILVGKVYHGFHGRGFDALNGNFSLCALNHIVGEHGMEVRNGRGQDNTMSVEQTVIYLYGTTRSFSHVC